MPKPTSLAVAIGIVAALLSLAPASVSGCTCVPTPPPCAALWESDAVFTGIVHEIESRSDDTGFVRNRVKFTAVEFWHGDQSSVVDVLTGRGGGDCGYRFEIGQRYVVYANRTESSGGLVTSICHRTRPISEAAEDLAYFASLASAPRGGTIYGSVERRRRPRGGETTSTRERLRGVKVTIANESTTVTAVTDEEGRYRAEGLTPGAHSVRVSAENTFSFPAGDSLHVVTVNVADRGCAEANLVLLSVMEVRGRVVTHDGDPAAKVLVELLPDEGSRESVEPSFDYTDEHGRFEIEPSSAGAYVLGVNVTRVPDVERPIAPTYYPAAPERADAEVIRIDEGEILEGYSLRLPFPLAVGVISGVVRWPDGRPVEGAHVTMHDEAFPNTNGRGMFETTDAEGRFALKGLEGRRYSVRAVVNLKPEGQRHAEPVKAETGEEQTPLVLVITEPNGTCAKCRMRR